MSAQFRAVGSCDTAFQVLMAQGDNQEVLRQVGLCRVLTFLAARTAFRGSSAD